MLTADTPKPHAQSRSRTLCTSATNLSALLEHRMYPLALLLKSIYTHTTCERETCVQCALTTTAAATRIQTKDYRIFHCARQRLRLRRDATRRDGARGSWRNTSSGLRVSVCVCRCVKSRRARVHAENAARCHLGSSGRARTRTHTRGIIY